MRKSNDRGAASARRNAQSSLREDLEALSDQISKLGSKGWGEGQELIAAEIERLKTGVESVVEKMTEQGEHSYDQITELVKRRPVASLCTAFGVGLVLAALFSRRS